MKAKVFRNILAHSYYGPNNQLIYGLEAYKIFKRKALWLTPALADPLQTLPEHEKPIALRWLKNKKISGWEWSNEVWEQIRFRRQGINH